MARKDEIESIAFTIDSLLNERMSSDSPVSKQLDVLLDLPSTEYDKVLAALAKRELEKGSSDGILSFDGDGVEDFSYSLNDDALDRELSEMLGPYEQAKALMLADTENWRNVVGQAKLFFSSTSMPDPSILAGTLLQHLGEMSSAAQRGYLEDRLQKIHSQIYDEANPRIYPELSVEDRMMKLGLECVFKDRAVIAPATQQNSVEQTAPSVPSQAVSVSKPRR